MSTDPFIAAARTRIDAEADAKRLVGKAMRDVWTDYGEYTLLPEVLAPRIVEWARAYLAKQEPTDDAVCELIEDRLHDAMFTACVQEPDGEMTTYVDAPMIEVTRIVRDALTAAHATR